ncbi:MAG: hypothetical protein ACNA7G_09320 [Methylobacter sp.]
MTDFKPPSLNAQIKTTEQHIVQHQHALDSGAQALTSKIQQQIAKPANLLLAASLGFMVGELTRHRCRTPEHPHAVETSPLKTALSLVSSARTLYAALPLLLMITSR